MRARDGAVRIKVNIAVERVVSWTVKVSAILTTV